MCDGGPLTDHVAHIGLIAAVNEHHAREKVHARRQVDLERRQEARIGNMLRGVHAGEREGAAHARPCRALRAPSAPVENVGVPEESIPRGRGEGACGAERRVDAPERVGVAGVVRERNRMHARAVRGHITERHPYIDELRRLSSEPHVGDPAVRGPAAARRRDVPGPHVVDEPVVVPDERGDTLASLRGKRPRLVEGIDEESGQLDRAQRLDRSDERDTNGGVGNRAGVCKALTLESAALDEIRVTARVGRGRDVGVPRSPAAIEPKSRGDSRQRVRRAREVQEGLHGGGKGLHGAGIVGPQSIELCSELGYGRRMNGPAPRRIPVIRGRGTDVV